MPPGGVDLFEVDFKLPFWDPELFVAADRLDKELDSIAGIEEAAFNEKAIIKDCRRVGAAGDAPSDELSIFAQSDACFQIDPLFFKEGGRIRKEPPLLAQVFNMISVFRCQIFP